MLVKTYGAAVYGINATIITIEVNISQGVNFFLVGLPDNAVKESQQRIDSALRTNGYKLPGKKVVINMAPADIRKEGSAYDLPLALGVLAGYSVMGLACISPVGLNLRIYILPSFSSSAANSGASSECHSAGK